MAIAYESESSTLGSTVGATDFYKLTCPADTNHVRFKIKDKSAVVQPLPQLLNFRISKTGVTPVDATELKATQESILHLQGGSGKYVMTADTTGTNLDLTKAQSYKYQYQCLYADGSSTKPKIVTKKTLKNGAKATIAIACADTKQTRTQPKRYVDQLKVTITNTTAMPLVLTASNQVLNAQLSKRDAGSSPINKIYAVNASDINGDGEYGAEVIVDGGDGDYFLTVNNTGTNPAADNSKVYAFELNCLSSANSDTGEVVVLPIQNQ